MRRLRLLLCACLLTPAVGCTWMRDTMGVGNRPSNNATGAIPKVTAEQLVGYLNGQAERLKNVNYGEATVSAREGDGLKGVITERAYPTLRGRLSASQPRNFRMVATGGLVDAKVDLGSNPDQFWAYLQAPTMQPMYVFASHSDFEANKAKLPGNMPFEPDWVLQALGMTKFPTDAAYEEVSAAATPVSTGGGRSPLRAVPVNERDRTYTLRWPATMPNGTQVKKEVIFAADDADASRNEPQVRRHLIRDLRGKLLCSAEIKSARTVPVGGTDPATGRPFVVQYPTEVVLRWEEQKFEMTLKLDSAKVNQEMTQQDMRRLFDLPNIPGANPVDLAHAKFDMTGR